MSEFSIRTGRFATSILRASLLSLALSMLVLWLLVRAQPAQAGAVVTTCDEPSLRAALAGGGSVTFSCFGIPVITLMSEIVITTNTAIDGWNHGAIVTLNGMRVFSVTNNATVTLMDLTLGGTYANGNGGCIYTNGPLLLDRVTMTQCHAGPGARGGALYVDGAGSATLINTSVRDNFAHDGGGVFSVGALALSNSYFAHNASQGTDGGGLLTLGATRIDNTIFYSNTAPRYGGAIYNAGTLSVTNSIFDDNWAGRGGGMIQTFLGSSDLLNVTFSGNRANLGGGLNNSGGDVRLTNVTFSANDAGTGAGIYIDSGTVLLRDVTLDRNNAGAGGGIRNIGVVTVTNSTFSGNRGQSGGGGLDNWGTATVVNSTFSGNSAPEHDMWSFTGGGAIMNNGGKVTLQNVTIISNTAGDFGGGIGNVSEPTNGALFYGPVGLMNSIIDNNTPNNCGSGFVVETQFVTSASYNLSSDNSCPLTATGDMTNTPAMLGPLANNGGPTQTRMPLAGSPAIDAIPIGRNGCGTTLIRDQRGAVRPINSKCDIGAVEYGAMLPMLWLPFVAR